MQIHAKGKKTEALKKGLGFCGLFTLKSIQPARWSRAAPEMA